MDYKAISGPVLGSAYSTVVSLSSVSSATPVCKNADSSFRKCNKTTVIKYNIKTMKKI